MNRRTVPFIAEVSSNHHRDPERCYRFIDVSAATGCASVKFQLFRIDILAESQPIKVVKNLSKALNQ